VGQFANFIRAPLTFLFPRQRNEDLVADHVIREHHRGRSLDDILKDAYVTNRIAPEKVNRILDRPEVLRAVGEDIVAARRTAGPA